MRKFTDETQLTFIENNYTFKEIEDYIINLAKNSINETIACESKNIMILMKRPIANKELIIRTSNRINELTQLYEQLSWIKWACHVVTNKEHDNFYLKFNNGIVWGFITPNYVG